MDYNKVIQAGRLTRDPKLSYTPSQTAVVEFGIANNQKWVKDGQQQEKVLYLDCFMYGKRAETVNKYFKKGDPILVEGSLELDQWEQDDGLKRSRIRLKVQNFEFVAGAEEKAKAKPQEQSKPKVDDDDPGIPF